MPTYLSPTSTAALRSSGRLSSSMTRSRTAASVLRAGSSVALVASTAKRLSRYKADPAGCNSCPLKLQCAASSAGRDPQEFPRAVSRPSAGIPADKGVLAGLQETKFADRAIIRRGEGLARDEEVQATRIGTGQHGSLARGNWPEPRETPPGELGTEVVAGWWGFLGC